MRPLSIIATLLTLICFTTFSNAQTRFESDDPLNQLLNTQFMEKFMDMRVAAESTVRSFKSQQEAYSPRDIARVQVAYDRTAEKFNFVLRGIKEDLLDKKKLKYIERYPDDYAKELELDMYKLSDFYANNYQQVLADVTADQVDGSAVLVLISGILDVSFNIFGLVKNIGNLVSKNKARKQYFNQERLEKVLIKPHIWTLWHEFDNQGNMYETPDNTAQNLSTLYQDQDATFNSNQTNNGQTYSQQKLNDYKAKQALKEAKANPGSPVFDPELDPPFDPNAEPGIFPVPDDNEGLDENGNPLPSSEGSTSPTTNGVNGTNPPNATASPSDKNKVGTINIAIPKPKKKENG